MMRILLRNLALLLLAAAGMQVGEVRKRGGVIPSRHCFVRLGADAATWGLYFFEHPRAYARQQGMNVPSERSHARRL